MADAQVSAILEKLTTILDEQVRQNVQLVAEVEEEMRKMEDFYRNIVLVLKDASERQIAERDVRAWLRKVTDVSYEIEDVLDEWNSALLRMHILKDQKQEDYSPCENQVNYHLDITQKIKELQRKLEEISMEKEQFNFNTSRGSQELVGLVNAVNIIEPQVRGRDYAKKIIKERLFCEANEKSKAFQVISIIGIGGIGKTTLARSVYDDKEVKAHFDCRIWVSVSDPFDEVKVAKVIVENIYGFPRYYEELNIYLGEIKSGIKGKRFLIVLDNVWTEDFKIWKQLEYSLKTGEPGSKVLVTSRRKEVAQMMKSIHTHYVEKLGEEECWLLFYDIAFQGRRLEKYKKLEEIGKELVKKCNGLPLAVKVLACLMYQKESNQDWHMILESKLWDFQKVETELCPSLVLSYFELPSIVQRCLLYCAIYPRGEIIFKDELVKLWMAQGYLGSGTDDEMETRGDNYFKCMISRSFFENIEKSKLDGNIISGKMHDTVYDLTQFLHNRECFALDIDAPTRLDTDLSIGRLVCFQGKQKDKIPSLISNMKETRSLLINPHSSEQVCDLFDDPCPTITQADFYLSLTHLRVLRLSYAVGTVPKEVGKLTHLRYIHLSSKSTYLTELPETLCNLYNLQTLILDCYGIEKLPQNIGKLVNLRHLDVEGCNLKYIPKGICRLSASLQTMTKFAISDDPEACKLGDLGSFNKLQGGIAIKKFRYVDPSEFQKVDLKSKHISRLSLYASREVYFTDNAIDALLPRNLEVLRVFGFQEPSILNGIMCLNNLRKLEFYSCTGFGRLPPLGRLPFLVSLIIRGVDSVTKIGAEFLGIQVKECSKISTNAIAFPKLEELRFSYMRDLEEWVGIQCQEENQNQMLKIMPCLSYLHLEECSRLKVLPQFIKKTPLQALYIFYCDDVGARCLSETREDWDIISHVPNIRIIGPDSCAQGHFRDYV